MTPRACPQFQWVKLEELAGPELEAEGERLIERVSGPVLSPKDAAVAADH